MRGRALVPHVSMWMGYAMALSGLALWSLALALLVGGTVLFVAGGLMLRGDA